MLQLARSREFAPNDVVNCPAPSKYNVLFVPKVIPKLRGRIDPVVARRSATTEARIFVAAV